MPRRRKRFGLFLPTGGVKYPAIVSLKTPREARRSVRRLGGEFRRASTRAKKVHIVRVANQAANRAEVMSKNRNLRPKTRKQKRTVERIYRQATRRFSKATPKRRR